MKEIDKPDLATFSRFCKTLSLKDGAQLIEDYKKVHASGAFWPEITKEMHEVGIIDMEIYNYGTSLFMIMDTVAGFNHDEAMKELAAKPRQSEWEAYVSEFQQTTAEATANDKWQLMERIFKLDQ
jgi:L-rhamnose mutarotase